MTDSSSRIRIIQQVQPHEIYNLAAQSHVAVSFEGPKYTANSDALSALRMLETIRILDFEKKPRIYQACAFELYDLMQEKPRRRKPRPSSANAVPVRLPSCVCPACCGGGGVRGSRSSKKNEGTHKGPLVH